MGVKQYSGSTSRKGQELKKNQNSYKDTKRNFIIIIVVVVLVIMIIIIMTS